MEIPKRIQKLPTDDVGRPVPWFVAWYDGKADFRVADGEKFVRAIKEQLCWVCGEKLGRYLCFVIGPMCAVNRTTAEPPVHLECGRFSVQACPFLSTPRMHRRERDLPEHQPAAGEMLRRNPAVSLLWVTHTYRLFPDEKGGALITVGEPTSLEMWREGREATFEELIDSVDSGLPILQQMAAEDPQPGAVEALEKAYRQALATLEKYLCHSAIMSFAK